MLRKFIVICSSDSRLTGFLRKKSFVVLKGVDLVKAAFLIKRRINKKVKKKDKKDKLNKIALSVDVVAFSWIKVRVRTTYCRFTHSQNYIFTT